MRKNYIYLLLFVLSFNLTNAQQTSLRGMYIDSFDDILGISAKEDSLLQYIQDSSYNYMALYSLQALNLNNTTTANKLAAFIKRAKNNYGVQYVGAVVESYSGIQNKIVPYNNSRTDDNEKFNVFNLEFEFWTTSSVNPGGYYCTQYLQPNNCSCDTSGGFKYFIEQMHLIDSMAAVQQVISETYVGWFNQGQASQMQQNVDRILVHAYRTNSTSLFSYSKNRLQYLASNNSNIDVVPIFSSEPNFMGPWLESNSQTGAYDNYKSDFDNDNSAWKQYINILGYQWFTWEFMPKPVPGSGPYNPMITSSGSYSLCTGDSIILTATSGDSYQWSNGATTRSIVVYTGGSYSCNILFNSSQYSTPTVLVTENNKPTVTISQGMLTNNQVEITAVATAGSGTIASYQWKLNGSYINGATSPSYFATVTGDYALKVMNDYGCSKESAIENVNIPGSICVASTPSGLASTAVTEVDYMLSWLPGQTGDSIVVRYEIDNGANEYQYVRMINNGQNSVLLSGLQPNTNYGWRVKMICGSTSGSYSSKAYFTTGSTSTGIHQVKEENENGEFNFHTYPNPATDQINVDIHAINPGVTELVLTDINARIILSEKLNVQQGDNKHKLDVSGFSRGVYFISVTNEEKTMTKKLIVGG
jgi:hypothetical protein